MSNPIYTGHEHFVKVVAVGRGRRFLESFVSYYPLIFAPMEPESFNFLYIRFGKSWFHHVKKNIALLKLLLCLRNIIIKQSS